MSELSVNSAGVLVGSWLFCIHNFLCFVSFWCILEVDVEVRTNILMRLIGVQTHFSASWHAKMT